jgi:hypothetical protein
MSRRRVVLELALVFAAAANLCAQAAHPAPKSATEVFQQSVTGPERATLRLAESMPDGKYSFPQMVNSAACARLRNSLSTLP